MRDGVLRMANELKFEITRRSRGLLEPFVAATTLGQRHQREGYATFRRLTDHLSGHCAASHHGLRRNSPCNEEKEREWQWGACLLHRREREGLCGVVRLKKSAFKGSCGWAILKPNQQLVLKSTSCWLSTAIDSTLLVNKRMRHSDVAHSIRRACRQN